jgi:hypothetical protein
LLSLSLSSSDPDTSPLLGAVGLFTLGRANASLVSVGLPTLGRANASLVGVGGTFAGDMLISKCMGSPRLTFPFPPDGQIIPLSDPSATSTLPPDT